MSYEGGSDSTSASEGYDGNSENSTVDSGDTSALDELYEGGDSYSEASDELYEGDSTGSEADENTELNSQSDKIEEPESSEDPERENFEEDEPEEEEKTAEEKAEEEKNPDQEENTEQDEEAEHEEINEKSEYSEEVNDNIKSVEELEVYQKAGLKEEIVDGKTALVRDDIDWDQKDEFGRTNRERVEEKGLVPCNKDGEEIELHHIGQKDDSPLAELTFQEHRGKGNDTILHDKSKESEIKRSEFITARKAYWKERAKI